MAILTINEALCRKDGICAEVCPTRFIKGGVGVIPKGRDGVGMCIACGHCMAFCPHDAIIVTKLAAEPVTKLDRKILPDAAAVDLVCKSRRSTRIFKDTPVDQKVVEKILHAANYAPTGKNIRNLRHIIIYDTAKLREFAEVAVGAMEKDIAKNPASSMAESASLVRGFRSGKDPIFRKAPHLLLTIAPKDWAWRSVDASIFLTYFEVLGTAHGLGLCWAGYICRAASVLPEVREYLGVGEDEEVCGGQLFGLPKYRVQSIPPRLPYKVDWR